MTGGAGESDVTEMPEQEGTPQRSWWEEKMERKLQSRCGRQSREECAEDEVSSWPRGRCLARQPHPIETGVRAADAAFADIGPDSAEVALLAAARMGHPTAFSHLVGPHAGRMRRMAFRITRNREDAEDAVQECFMNAFAHFESFRGQSQFSTWLTRIALNAALLRIRARRREPVHPNDSTEALSAVKHDHAPCACPTPEQSYRRRELKNILAEEIARLNPDHRRALRLCYTKELKTQEAARVLGIPHSTLKTQVRRARLALRRRLNRRGIGKREFTQNHEIRSNSSH